MELEVKGVYKKFGKSWVLENINFKAKSGEVILLLGANATGKSTLLKIIATIMKPTRGVVLLDGENVVEKPEAIRKFLSYNPEIPILVNELSLDENLKFFARLYGYKGNLEKLKENFGLRDGKKNVLKLSKGMRQRLSLAISMMRKPRIVILDEPTSGLDRETISFTLNLIEELSKNGSIVIVTSHDEEDLSKVATRVLILENGNLICDMPLEDVERRRLVEIMLPSGKETVHISDLEKMENYKIIRVLGIRESISLERQDIRSG